MTISLSDVGAVKQNFVATYPVQEAFASVTRSPIAFKHHRAAASYDLAVASQHFERPTQGPGSLRRQVDLPPVALI